MDWDHLVIIGALALIFTPLERLFPAGPSNWSRRRLATDILHLLVGGYIIRWATLAAMVALGLLLGRLVPPAWPEFVRSQPDWIEFTELFLLSDLAFYLAHRLMHTVPALWRFHEVHHSSERLDWLAAYRVHPVDQIINNAIIAIPTLVLGFSPFLVLLFSLIYQVHALLLHSNIRVDFGVVGWVVASPRYHHWHHADIAEAHNRNFGGQLVIFDLLFRTLHFPSTRPEKQGLGESFPTTFLGQLAYPFGKGR